jgi:nitroreductase
MKTTLASAIALVSAVAIAADIKLPDPVRTGGKPLNEALAARQTHRDFSTAPLTDQELSDLLWAANGFNRPDQKKRTAPTAVNRQEVDIYVCRADGAYFWDSEANVLKQVTDKDLRGFTGRMGSPENFALVAPIALVYVIDYERQGMQQRPQDAFKYASVDCGFIGQNVYLHAAAAGLHTVFLGSLDPAKLSEALGLPPHRVPLFAQTVGRRPE